MKKKILVVGGAGYIGSHVVLALLDGNYEVVVLDDLSTGSKINLFEEVPFYQGDMSDPLVLRDLFQKEPISTVVHLAALKAAGESMNDPSAYAIHNISGALTLLSECLTADISKFIFSSSAAVYGDPEYIPLDENHPVNPENFYGFTKLEIERVLGWYGKLKGLKFASLRYFNAAGYDADGRVKGLERNPQNLIPIVMEVATGDRAHLDVFGTDYPTRDGSCIRDYIHVTDLANAHVAAIDHLDNHHSITCNLGTGEGTSVLEVIKSFETVLGSKLPVQLVGRRLGDPAKLMAKAELAEAHLGWMPHHSSIENILKTTWSIYQK